MLFILFSGADLERGGGGARGHSPFKPWDCNVTSSV